MCEETTANVAPSTCKEASYCEAAWLVKHLKKESHLTWFHLPVRQYCYVVNQSESVRQADLMGLPQFVKSRCFVRQPHLSSQSYFMR
jgi:hypothetical protein